MANQALPELADPGHWQRSVLSPLRWPGSKRQLVRHLAALLTALPDGKPTLFVEPFCGGATAALHAVGNRLVDRAILADSDPLVASFWYTSAFDTQWLVDAMMAEPVTLNRWDHWRNTTPGSVRDAALKCLFLNRTSFSGIIDDRAGPIGGRTQTSNSRIDCRFGKPGLAERIRQVGNLADTGRLLDVWEADWADTLRRTGPGNSTVSDSHRILYLDPPYVNKGPRLYRETFNADNHTRLAETLHNPAVGHWILSYDNDQSIRGLYRDTPGGVFTTVGHRYSTRSGRRTGSDELLITTIATADTPGGGPPLHPCAEMPE